MKRLLADNELEKLISYVALQMGLHRIVCSMSVDVETGQRGYLLTGEKAYLEPYNNAIKTIDQEMNQLRKLTVNNKGLQRRLDLLEPLITGYFL